MMGGLTSHHTHTLTPLHKQPFTASNIKIKDEPNDVKTTTRATRLVVSQFSISGIRKIRTRTRARGGREDPGEENEREETKSKS